MKIRAARVVGFSRSAWVDIAPVTCAGGVQGPFDPSGAQCRGVGSPGTGRRLPRGRGTRGARHVAPVFTTRRICVRFVFGLVLMDAMFEIFILFGSIDIGEWWFCHFRKVFVFSLRGLVCGKFQVCIRCGFILWFYEI